MNPTAISPDGTQVAVGARDGTTWVWNVASGERMAVLERHIGRVTCVAWSPDGRTIASGGENGKVETWCVETRTSGQGFPHNHMVNAIVWGADGSVIITKCDDGTVRVWNMTNGAEIAVLEGSWLRGDDGDTGHGDTGHGATDDGTTHDDDDEREIVLSLPPDWLWTGVDDSAYMADATETAWETAVSRALFKRGYEVSFEHGDPAVWEIVDDEKTIPDAGVINEVWGIVFSVPVDYIPVVDDPDPRDMVDEDVIPNEPPDVTDGTDGDEGFSLADASTAPFAWMVENLDPVAVFGIHRDGVAGYLFGVAQTAAEAGGLTAKAAQHWLVSDEGWAARRWLAEWVAQETQGNCNVVLVSTTNKVATIKAVRTLTGIGLASAKARVGDTPATVLEGVATEVAEYAKSKLEAAGAVVEIK